MTNPTKSRRRFTAQQKQEGLSCNAVAQRLGLPSSSLARWVRQARIDLGQAAPRDQGLLTSEKRAELNHPRKENRELRRDKDFFQAGGSALCQGAAAAKRSRLIEQLTDQHGVPWVCRQLGVARCGYYAWRQRQQSPGSRAAENAGLSAEIQAVFQHRRGFYGSPRIHQELRAVGRSVGCHRVARLMQRAQLKALEQTHPALLEGQHWGRWRGRKPAAAGLPAACFQPLLGR